VTGKVKESLEQEIVSLKMSHGQDLKELREEMDQIRLQRDRAVAMNEEMEQRMESMH